MKMEQMPLQTPEQRKTFIQNHESGIYSGTNEEGEKVLILLDRGKGMAIKTIARDKPHWYQCRDYDADGNCESDYVESIE